jgi:hypothetical protein
MSDADKYRGLHGLSHTPGPHQAKAEPSLADRLAAQRAAFAGHKSTEGPIQFGRAAGQRHNIARAVEAQEERKRQQAEHEAQETERRELAALSRPQSMVRDALRMGGCPHRALAQIADDDLAVARQLLADEMEGRRE